MLRHGDEARDSVLRALELAPRSVKARISAAGYYLNAPGFAGGDAARAREILLGALELDPENRNDRFLILGWLAVASSELGNEADAERYYHRARSIYAESSWLAEIGREIGVR
jgi:tetratricopeptide (TPR) repeat protein